ncbi:YwqG family protein [Microbulbifer yueqingensis]|nr:DUF1963 domain-containing protein [Microbulbifer yueqingensis]
MSISADAILTILVFLIVALHLYRRFRKESLRRTAAPSGPHPHERPHLDPQEVERALEKIDERLEQHRLDYICIRPQAERAKAPWQSKFGGRAYWPRSEPYPEGNDGQRLFLLAQLNLEEIPTLPSLPGLPDSGLLQFFVSDDELLGLPLDMPQPPLEGGTRGNYRVVFHAEVEQDRDRLTQDVPHTRDTTHFPLREEYALTFSRESGLPALADYRFAATGIDLAAMPDEIMDELFDRNEAAGSRIGGYANFTQDDPRHGQPLGAWPLLFQMDSHSSEGVEIMWGDAGVANFFIRPEDLERRDFSRVWYNWDCC